MFRPLLLLPVLALMACDTTDPTGDATPREVEWWDGRFEKAFASKPEEVVVMPGFRVAADSIRVRATTDAGTAEEITARGDVWIEAFGTRTTLGRAEKVTVEQGLATLSGAPQAIQGDELLLADESARLVLHPNTRVGITGNVQTMKRPVQRPSPRAERSTPKPAPPAKPSPKPPANPSVEPEEETRKKTAPVPDHLLNKMLVPGE